MLMMRKMMKKRKGFTLIELIVVIAILGILAAVAIPRFTGMRHESTVKAEGSTAASLMSAARVQEADNGIAVGPSSATAVALTNVENDTTVKAGDGKIFKKYMVFTDTMYSIKKTGDLYVITWDSAAGGDYAGKPQILTEGKAFEANKDETLP